MAQIMICKYCEEDAGDYRWHRKCREIALEDLLYRLRKQLEEDYGTVVSRMIKQEILAETFRSKEEIEREFKKVEELELAKKRWKNDFAEAMQKAAVEWQREHPDPNPPTY